MIDYHIHTQHSTDASGGVTEYCLRALEIGLTEICFTNHCEIDPHRADALIRFDGETLPFSRKNLLRLQDEIHALRERFAPEGLVIKFGIEVGYDRGIESTIRDMLTDVELDFVIGAVHCLDHICIDSTKECGRYFESHGVDRFLNDYYDAVADLAASRLFDSVAHLDVYKKYGRPFYGPGIDDPPLEAVGRAIQAMKENNICLEINTAGMRFLNEFYPSAKLMRMAREAGLEDITVGSDSHRPADVGKDIERALDYARYYGFSAICTYTRRKPSRINLEK